MQKIKNIFPIFSVLLITVLVFGIFKCFKQDIHYKFQPLGVSISQFKADWGKPDYEFENPNSDENIILKYNCNNLSQDQYIFVFERAGKTLKEKFYDD